VLKELLSTSDENTVEALKAALGVEKLEVVLLDSVEEYYFLLLAGPEARN
jgi:hypothetical protein